VLCRFQQLEICIATLKHSRWVKLDTLFYATVDRMKQNSLLHRGQKRKQKINYSLSRARKTKLKKVNTTRLAPVKRFLYSHIARLHNFFFQDGQV
jgi:hypothetical protein